MPAVTRIGDRDVDHCSSMTRAVGSPNVFANDIAVSRQGDANTEHEIPDSDDTCSNHTAGIALGSTTVILNDARGIGRIGDGVSDCTSVAEGSPNVFAGG